MPGQRGVCGQVWSQDDGSGGAQCLPAAPLLSWLMIQLAGGGGQPIGALLVTMMMLAAVQMMMVNGHPENDDLNECGEQNDDGLGFDEI